MLSDQKIQSNSRLGFIGLGHLGSPIARRLAAKFPLVVYDRDRAKAEELRALGATIADDPRSLAVDADVVLSCLPDGAAVEDLYLGSGNVLRSARPTARIIELSTIAPETSRMLHEAARGYGISMLDVAISGSSPAAEAGALTLFGGGERAIFESVEPIFSPIARQWFYMGPSGSGVAMKLVEHAAGSGNAGHRRSPRARCPAGPAPRSSFRHAGENRCRSAGPHGQTACRGKARLYAAVSSPPDAQGFRPDSGRGRGTGSFHARHGSRGRRERRRSCQRPRGGLLRRDRTDDPDVCVREHAHRETLRGNINLETERK